VLGVNLVAMLFAVDVDLFLVFHWNVVVLGKVLRTKELVVTHSFFEDIKAFDRDASAA
jgi:hypothetical protein